MLDTTMPASSVGSSRAGTTWLAWSGALGFLGVAAGAFGAHALRGVLSERLQTVYQTAVQYQLIHALALGLVAVLATVGIGERWPRRAGVCFVTGTLVFSGSLYLLCLTQTSWLGAITPLGGVLFLGGWVCLFMAAIASRRFMQSEREGKSL